MLRLFLNLKNRLGKWPVGSPILMGLACLYAPFTTQNIFSLLIGLVVFSAVAIFLERRIGALGIVALYMVGWVGANFVQAPFLRQPVLSLGIAGAVCATVGAYAVYFWEEKFQFRRFTIPGWSYVGVCAAVALFAAPIPLGALSGFMIGAMFALLQGEVFPLKKTFLFLQEQKLYYAAKDEPTLERKLEIFQQIYELNKESFYSFRAMFLYFCKQGFQFKSLSDEHQNFVSEIITRCFAYAEINNKYVFSHEIISLIPLSWDLNRLNLQVTAGQIRTRAKSFRKLNDFMQTLRLYDLFLDKFAAHPKAEAVQADIMKIFDEIEKFNVEDKAQTLGLLLAYADHHGAIHFQTQLKQLIHQVHREEKDAANS